MKTLRIVVFAIVLPLATGVTPDGGQVPGISPAVGEVVGKGLLARLACGACVGSYATLTLQGWEAVWSVALAGPCAEVCEAAF